MADRRNHDAIAYWLAQVSRAATTYERRWTWGALRRVDPALAEAMADQKRLFDQATITGTAGDVETQGAATVRGWNACVQAMEAANAEDDSFVIGQDPRTGFRVAIGYQRAGAERVAELHGRSVCWVSPDEVAGIMAGIEGFKVIDAIKRHFPGAEVIDREPDEPAKSDSGVEEAA